MWCNIVQMVLTLTLVLALYKQGIVAIVWGYSVFTILWLIVWHLSTGRLIGLHIFDVIKDTVPFFAIALAVMVATHFLTQGIGNLIILLVVRIVIATALYLGIMKLLRAKILEESIEFILKKKRK